MAPKPLTRAAVLSKAIDDFFALVEKPEPTEAARAANLEAGYKLLEQAREAEDQRMERKYRK